MTRRQDEAQTVAIDATGNGRVRVLAGATGTSGRYALVEISGVRGDGPPRHCHAAEDESIYVLAGRLTVTHDGHDRSLTEGEFIVLPRGKDHTYRIASEVARLLVVIAPAGLESSYLDGVWHSDDLERLVAVAASFGIEVTGPPLESDDSDEGFSP